MAGTYILGEQKVRPGTYFRIENAGGGQVEGADDGTVCAIFKADFGPTEKAVELTPYDGYTATYGDGKTTDMLKEILDAGVKKCICIRLGSGGTAATVSLKTSGESVKDALKITAKHVGSKNFTVTVRTKASDSSVRQIIIYSNAKQFERFEYAVTENEAPVAAAAINKSANFSAEALSTTGALADVDATAFTVGTDPTITTDDYSQALSIAEKYRFNTIAVDTNDHAVHLLLQAFLTRIYDVGQLGFAVVADDPDSVDLDAREDNAKSFNDLRMIYVLNPYVEKSGVEYKGYLVAAKIAALYALCPSNKSLTHTVIQGYTKLGEELTPTQITKAEQLGCLVLSTNPSGQIWIDYAINTLISPTDDQDDGWKKMRRAKCRYELLLRCNDTADKLIGKVDNDVNGRATVIAQLQAVVNAMINESKLVAGTVTESAVYQSDGDYAYFVLDIVDKDSIEHLYLTYRFRFSSIVVTE